MNDDDNDKDDDEDLGVACTRLHLYIVGPAGYLDAFSET